MPDEQRAKGKPFNGPRYCLRSIEREIRKEGEKKGCRLVFGPSDYRTFLVTNGLEERWVRKAGLEAEWESTEQWVEKWTQGRATSFFVNSFGTNTLITALGADGERYTFFNEQLGKSAILRNTTVASANEGIRRGYKGKVFDERSKVDPAPNILNAAIRGLDEEMGLRPEHTGDTRPIMLSVGRVVSNAQPAALFYWPLNIPVASVVKAAASASDRHFEFANLKHKGTVPGLHVVPFTREAVSAFILDQETLSPFTSWTRALVYYSFLHVESGQTRAGKERLLPDIGRAKSPRRSQVAKERWLVTQLKQLADGTYTYISADNNKKLLKETLETYKRKKKYELWIDEPRNSIEVLRDGKYRSIGPIHNYKTRDFAFLIVVLTNVGKTLTYEAIVKEIHLDRIEEDSVPEYKSHLCKALGPTRVYDLCDRMIQAKGTRQYYFPKEGWSFLRIHKSEPDK